MKGWTILIVAVMILAVVVGQSPTPSQCTEEKNQLENTCRTVSVMFGRDPTAACCQLVRAAHVECVCPFVTWKLVAALGGVQRAIRLIESCGRNVPHNFKCGSVTTP
ncbi:hypothetical protein DH2020_030675 [Rehmannia glutinosa]|uniref:Bifunctional inhibitor/plant lipid transfer protein/seed storage helical domain-containing protein n=1 Tax=Rehmannia glutinosa TaxID=99300 RepID=A0ABR0VNJ9_REHGL